MSTLVDRARALLEAGTVQVVIGFGAGSEPGRVRPVFVRKAEACDSLVADARHRPNLCTYLLKPEIRAMGRPAIVVGAAGLRTLLQLAVENQITDGAVHVLYLDADGAVCELPTLAAIEERAAMLPPDAVVSAPAPGATGAATSAASAGPVGIEQVDALPLDERWAFWQNELSRCIRCYACRAACPLCYCSRCIVDVNQPQWIPVAADAFGTLEWNVVRAMHLAGRCVECGSCADACPVGIRIDLLNRVLASEARSHFGAEPGRSLRREYALSTFRPDDTADFIR